MIRNKTRKAFTLMELMIVIIILGLLASMVLPNLTGKSQRAKQKITCTQMKIIYENLKSFKLDNGRYPSTSEGLDALIKTPDKELVSYPEGGYFSDDKLPKDAWGGNFIYVYNDTIEIVSLGSDHKEGGDGEAKDIYLSKCK